MDQGPLVTSDLYDGAEFARKLAAHWPVKAAFWLRRADDYKAYLYIGIEGIDGASKMPVYHDVNEVGREMSNIYFDRYRVKILGVNDPLARAAIDLNEQYPDPIGHRGGPQMFGGIFAEELFVYPTIQPAAVG
jgi:hypothetical protein